MMTKQKAVLAVLIVLLCGSVHAQQYRMYVGTYTDKTASKGIYVFNYDAESGQFMPLGLAAESKNPSFLAASGDGKLVYAVNEVGDYESKSSGGVSAYQVEQTTGKLKFLNEVASRGADPCYIAFDKTGHVLLVANYTGGSVAVFPVQPDGRLKEASGVVQHSGSSGNKERQEGPHAHWIETSPDNHYALAADLGSDELVVYRFDASTGRLSPNTPPFAKVSGGSGPRHATFSPDGKFVYLLSELKSEVAVFRYNGGRLKEIQTVTALPADYSAANDAAEIVMHRSGKFLYTSNRGADSIAVFRVDAKKGTLSLTENTPTQGKTPRNFAIDPTGQLLLVANQESGNIVVFRIDPGTGRLTPMGKKLEAPAPVCIVFLKAKL